MRRYIKILSICLCAFSLVACTAKEYRTDIHCRELCDETVEYVNDGLEYAEYGESQLKYEFGDAARGAEEYCILYSVKVEDINEIGVFFAKDEQNVKAIAEDCKKYIDDMKENKRAFISSYAPDQLPKLDKAEVRICGNYVMYAVLDPKDSELAYNQIKKRLTE